MAPAIEPFDCWSSVHQLRDHSMCLLRPEGLAAGYAGVPDMGFWLARATNWLTRYVQEGWAVPRALWPFVAISRPDAGYRINLPPMRLMGLPPSWRPESLAKFGMFRALVSKDMSLSAVKEWRPGTKGQWRHWLEAESLVEENREELVGIWVRPDIDLDPRRRFPRFFENPSLETQYKQLIKQLKTKRSKKDCDFLLAVGIQPTENPELQWNIQRIDPAFELHPELPLEGLPPDASQEDFSSALEQTVDVVTQRVLKLLEPPLPWSGIVLDTRTLDARRRTGRADDIHQRISSAQVLIAGLGALGSEVAHLLAQEGVGSFVLVDKDLLLPGNVARHRASLTDAGRPKVEAVQKDILRINPSAQVHACGNWIDEQVALLEKADGAAEPFVAVGLTGDEGSEHVLGEFCSHHQVHCIHAWMEMDGQVLRLFRVMSDRDPTLLDLGRDPRNSIPQLPPSSGLAVRPRECAEVVQPGSAGNIHAAANFIARIVLDTLSGHHEEENHWLFAPDGLRGTAAPVPSALRSRYGVSGTRLPLARGEDWQGVASTREP